MNVPMNARGWAKNPAVAVVALSIVAHLWKLGLRPLAHDEAIDAWFSWQARTFGTMRYDPVYHGPLRFYLEGPVLGILGTGAFQARLVAATAGVATTALIAASTKTLGRVGAPVGALAFVVSPTALSVTRTGREDSLVALVSVALLLIVAQSLVAPRPAHVVAGAALLAAGFGLKETTFLFALSALVFLVALAAVAVSRPGGPCRAPVQRLIGLGRYAWTWSLIVFAVTFMVIFTSAFRYADGFESGLLDGVRYWWSQHGVGRGGQPWFFYVVVYGAYEWLVLGLAAVGVLATIRQRSLTGAWFIWMAVAQLALYSWAGEKFAWLALHPLLPAVLLAGLGAQVIHHRVGIIASSRMIAATIAAALFALTAVVAARPAITHGADPRELLVTVQTSVDVPPIVERLKAGQRDGTIDTILIDDSGSGSWPWVWYLHDLHDVAYITFDPAAPWPDADALIVSADGDPPVVPAGYTVERFRLRVWWVPDYDAASVGDVARWFFTRETWSPRGSSDQYLVLRNG